MTRSARAAAAASAQGDRQRDPGGGGNIGERRLRHGRSSGMDPDLLRPSRAALPLWRSGRSRPRRARRHSLGGSLSGGFPLMAATMPSTSVLVGHRATFRRSRGALGRSPAQGCREYQRVGRTCGARWPRWNQPGREPSLFSGMVRTVRPSPHPDHSGNRATAPNRRRWPCTSSPNRPPGTQPGASPGDLEWLIGEPRTAARITASSGWRSVPERRSGTPRSWQ